MFLFRGSFVFPAKFMLVASASADGAFLNTAATKLNLSTRGCLKTLKVARTIADLDSRENITMADLTEALQFSSLALK